MKKLTTLIAEFVELKEKDARRSEFLRSFGNDPGALSLFSPYLVIVLHIVFIYVDVITQLGRVFTALSDYTELKEAVIARGPIRETRVETPSRDQLSSPVSLIPL